MRYLKLTLSMLLLMVFVQGCLLFNTVSYEVNIEGETSGSVNMQVNDIRSDALNVSQLDEDKNQLFNFMWKSQDFVQQMKEEGKIITDRQLYTMNGKLYGNISYNFTDITTVEGLQYQAPFYFLTLNPEDSIVSTNGEVILSDGLKRIMWDNSIQKLKFEMFSVDVEKGNLVELSQYLEAEK